MELIDKKGGFGIFQMGSKEVELLNRMKSLAENQNKYTLGCDKYPQTSEFSAVMKDLFPEVPPSGYNAHFFRENTYYQSFAPYQELMIDSRFPRGTILTKHGGDRSRLTIVFSNFAEQNQYPITMALTEFYTPNVVDDIVAILGKREVPVLEGLVHLLISERGQNRDYGYGIAEVHRLGAVLKIYERATELVKNAEKIIGFSDDNLKILRRDSLEHENLAIRDMSRVRYQKELHQLMNH